MENYTLEDGIAHAVERAKRDNERVNVYSDGETVWVRLAVAAAPRLPDNAKWIGEATPDGGFEWKDRDEFYVQMAKDYHGAAVRDNSRAELIAIGRGIEQLIAIGRGIEHGEED